MNFSGAKILFIKRLLKILLPTVLLFFVARTLFQDTESFSAIGSQIKLIWGLAALLFYFAGVLTIAINWIRILHILGASPDRLTSLESYYYSQLAKYIPGRVWGAAGRIVIMRGAGIPEGTTALGILLESILLMVSSSCVGFLALGSFGILPDEIRILAILSPLLLLILHPFFLHKAVRLMARTFPNHVIEPESLPGFRTMIGLSLRFCFVWLFQGTGFYCALNAFVDCPFDRFALTVGGNSLAWLAGFIVIFTPAGLGIREFLLTRIHTGIIGGSAAALTAFFARLLVIISEIMGSGALFMFRLIGKRKNQWRDA